MGLFVLASQCEDSGFTTGHDIVAAAFSVELDDQTEEFDFDMVQREKIVCIPQDWSLAQPFTGPSVSMRDSSISGWMSDKIAVGYIVEDFYSYIVPGDTT
jgi:hypothetical protein